MMAHCQRILIVLGISWLTSTIFNNWNIYIALAFTTTPPLLQTAQQLQKTEYAYYASSSARHMIVTKGGGRAPTLPDAPEDTNLTTWEATAPAPNEARLIVLQITDVYTLENFASFKALVEETKQKAPGATVVSMLTGDFLSPYLLSSVDRGAGMMRAIQRVPIDYLTWGNHEADISHRAVCHHVRKYAALGGKWLNSNMLDHAEMEHQLEYDVLEIASPNGEHSRKVGLCAVLSDDPALYSHFKAPGAFGGATIDDPWETLKKYNKLLKEEKDCDMVIPLQHLYVPDDHKTCQKFDFPIVLSGHDHHRVDEVVEGSRLIKPGMNAEHATALEISWNDPADEKPTIQSRFVKVDEWQGDPEVEEENERAYDALAPLRNTELARVPPSFEPLSSNGSRETVCTMGKFLCSLIKSSMQISRRQRGFGQVDAVILMGGNIRGNADYELGSFFSLESLEAEIKADEVIAVVNMPGWLLADGIQATHAGDPIPGWFQYDVGIVEDYSVSPPVVTRVASQPLDSDRIYKVATKVGDLTNGQSPPFEKYFTENPHELPPKGAYVNIHAELMGYFSRNLWRKLWDSITIQLDEECDIDDMGDDEDDSDCGDCNPVGRLATLDQSGDGVVTVEDIQVALRDRLGYSIDNREQSLAEFVNSFADTTGDGTVTLKDFEVFCAEMDEWSERDRWRLGERRPNKKAKDKSTTEKVI